jgi:hypothetical protein
VFPIVVGWTVFALVTACGGPQKAADGSSSVPTVKVVNPGSEPRQQIRYQPKPQAPDRMEMTLKVRVSTAFTNTALETGHRAADSPSMKISARMMAVTVMPSGDALLTCVIEDVAVLDDMIDPAMRRPIESESSALEGSRGSWQLSPAGIISNVVFEAAPGAQPVRNPRWNLRDVLRDASAVFPDEPIGVGAIWKVTSTQSIAGVTWKRRATYRLRDLSGSIASIDANVEMQASSQPLSVEPNATTRLTSGTSRARADLVIRLDGLFATGTSQGSNGINLNIVRRRQRITTTMQTETIVSVERREL